MNTYTVSIKIDAEDVYELEKILPKVLKARALIKYEHIITLDITDGLAIIRAEK